MLWIVALLLLQVQTAAAPRSWLDGLGVALFALGFIFGAVGDLANFPTRLDVVPDLARYLELRLLDRFDLAAPALLAGGLFILGGVLEGAVYPTRDHSGNSLALALLTLGEVPRASQSPRFRRA